MRESWSGLAGHLIEVTGHEHDTEHRAQRLPAARELPPVHPRQSHVRDEEIDRLFVVRQELERLGDVAHQDLEAGGPEHGLAQTPNRLLVPDEEDGFPP